MRGVTVLGLLAVSFGPWYAYTLLRLVYGSRWSESEAPVVLSWYTGYILLMSVNGGWLLLGIKGCGRQQPCVCCHTRG